MRTQDGPFLNNLHTSLTTDNVFKGVNVHTEPRRGDPEQRQAFQNLREEILRTLHSNITDRFPPVELLDAMKVGLVLGKRVLITLLIEHKCKNKIETKL